MIKKKRKESKVCYAHKGWKLTKHGLCIYHSMLWSKKGPDEPGDYAKNIRLRITIEEI